MRLTIRIKKGSDGSAALSCTRADGTATWQRQRGAQARFFPRHDLTHYAVETVLGFRHGFYGLVAEGWDLADFGHPWPRGPLPREAEDVERIVGCFDAERAGGQTWTAGAVSTARVPVSEAQLQQVRERMHGLFAAWDAVVPGGTLELAFEPSR